MRRFSLIAVLAVVSVFGAVVAQTPEGAKNDGNATAKAPDKPEGMPDMPPPGEHHKWLEQFVGTWTFESQMTGEGAPPMKCSGIDTARSLGARWVICELKTEMPGMGTMNAVLTLGYKPETGKYQGTWVDSMTDHMWVYVGTLDATKKILTLEAEGPNMMDPTKGNTKYRDVFEFKSADHRTLTSSALVDGKWVEFATANYRRKK